MSFGIQNLGVINQKDAPAIWESDAVDFPANFVKGRILIDTFQGGIYLDTSTTRVQIQAGGSGAILYQNGVETFGLTTPTSTNVGLGGSLVRNTIIDITPNTLEFSGINTSTIFDTKGYMQDGASGNNYFTTFVDTLDVIVPNQILIFTNPVNNQPYAVLAQEI